MFLGSELIRSIELSINAVAIVLIFVAFIHETKMENVNLVKTIHIISLMVGGYAPFLFSSAYMKSMAKAQKTFVLFTRYRCFNNSSR